MKKEIEEELKGLYFVGKDDLWVETFFAHLDSYVDNLLKSQTTQAAREAYDCGLDDRDFIAVIKQAKNEVIEEIEYRMNTVMIMIHNRNTEKEIKHYLDQVLEQLKKLI